MTQIITAYVYRVKAKKGLDALELPGEKVGSLELPRP